MTNKRGLINSFTLVLGFLLASSAGSLAHATDINCTTLPGDRADDRLLGCWYNINWTTRRDASGTRYEQPSERRTRSEARNNSIEVQFFHLPDSTIGRVEPPIYLRVLKHRNGIPEVIGQMDYDDYTSNAGRVAVNYHTLGNSTLTGLGMDSMPNINAAAFAFLGYEGLMKILRMKIGFPMPSILSVWQDARETVRRFEERAGRGARLQSAGYAAMSLFGIYMFWDATYGFAYSTIRDRMNTWLFSEAARYAYTLRLMLMYSQGCLVERQYCATMQTHINNQSLLSLAASSPDEAERFLERLQRDVEEELNGTMGADADLVFMTPVTPEPGSTTRAMQIEQAAEQLAAGDRVLMQRFRTQLSLGDLRSRPVQTRPAMPVTDLAEVENAWRAFFRPACPEGARSVRECRTGLGGPLAGRCVIGFDTLVNLFNGGGMTCVGPAAFYAPHNFFDYVRPGHSSPGHP